MAYTTEDYQKTSIYHPLIQDALDYAIEHLSSGWSNVQREKVKLELISQYGLSDQEAKAVLEVVIIGLMRANRLPKGVA